MRSLRRPLTLSLFLFLSLASACGGGADDPDVSSTATAGGDAISDLPPGDLDAALSGPQRSEENRARDRYRHPRETLTFFGIAPDMRVIEISPGGGWYTEILAPYLRGRGTLVAAIPGAEGRRARYRQAFLDLQASRPELFGAVEVVTFDTPDTIELGPDDSADMVLTFRNTHGMIGDGALDASMAAFFRVLRPGGVLGLVQHRAAEGADASESARGGYVPEAFVIEAATRAGFVLEERSEINANPADTRDHPEGVWALPPSLRHGDTDRERYLAIGESDRMTLRFRKPR